MTFKIAKSKVVKVPVTVSVPMDGGRFSTSIFHAQFEILGKQEFEDLSGDDDRLLMRCTKAVFDVKDENDEPLESNEENISTLIQIPYVRAAMVTAYVKSAFGNEGKRKN